MRALLLEIEEAVREEAAVGGEHLAPERAEDFERRYQRLLEAGLAARTRRPSVRARRGDGPNRARARTW